MRAVAPLLLLPFLLGAPFLLAPRAHADEPAHAYTLEARLDPVEHVVHGEGRIRWTNESERAQDTLLLHLYLNAFASDDSVFMQESGSQLRGVRFRGEGGITLERLVLDPDAPAAHDLLEGAEDELVEGDRTQLRVHLPRPVEPGESVELGMAWESRLPPVFARSGWHGAFHMVAQWFPKLARLEPGGEWASFPYHGHGEFYADFADYDLTVETPPGWVVGASGVMREERFTSASTVRRFEAERVHDVAFAAAPWFEELEDTFDGEAGPVHVRVLYPPGFRGAAERHLEVTLAGLAHYGAHYGSYPYPQLTVIVPPRGADGAAGMEYPTLFVTAGPWFRMGGLPIALHDEVTAHELGHMWFQGLVASNEVAWPMLDEGITEWVTGDLLQELHGRARSGIDLFGLRIDGFELRRALALGGRPTPPPARPAHAFSGNAYGRAVYGRSAAIFETVARTWGRARFRRALGRYAKAQRFRHPVPEDLLAAFGEEYGDWMPRRVLRPALFDNAICARRVTAPVREGGRTRVVATRVGLGLPTRLRLEGPDGRRSVPWPGDVERLEIDEAGTFTRVWVDPERRGLLDPEARDDAAGEREGGGIFRRALFWLQTVLGQVAP